MSESLAKLQASGTDTRPQQVIPVCLAQGVVKKVQVLTEELDNIEVELSRFGEDAEGEAPRKMASGGDLVSRRDEIGAEIERLYDVMREHTGRVTVAATISQGEWRRWADAHPAREDGRDANGWPVLRSYDMVVAGGYCDASALLDRVGDFVTEWDGEPLTSGQWEWLRDNIHPGDLKAVARAAVTLYEGEGAKALPKLSSASSATPPSATL